MISWPDFKFPPSTKVCKICREEKEIYYFSIHVGAFLGVRNTCKQCINKKEREKYIIKPRKEKRSREELLQKRKEYNNNYRIKNKDTRLKRMYGISLEEYQVLVERQEGKCACCHKEIANLYVDHCHTTGKIRGLLCQPCNTGIGILGDTFESIKRAYTYLRATKGE